MTELLFRPAVARRCSCKLEMVNTWTHATLMHVHTQHNFKCCWACGEAGGMWTCCALVPLKDTICSGSSLGWFVFGHYCQIIILRLNLALQTKLFHKRKICLKQLLRDWCHSEFWRSHGGQMSADLHKTNMHREPLKATLYSNKQALTRTLHMWEGIRSYMRLHISDNHVSDGMWGQITPEEMPEDWDFSRDVSLNALRHHFKNAGLNKPKIK